MCAGNVIVDKSCRASGIVGISGVYLERDPYVVYLHRSQACEITNPHSIIFLTQRPFSQDIREILYSSTNHSASTQDRVDTSLGPCVMSFLVLNALYLYKRFAKCYLRGRRELRSRVGSGNDYEI